MRPWPYTGALVLKYSGVGVIAESFHRQFLRHAIDIGLPILACNDITKKVEYGDELMADFNDGDIKNLTTGELFKAELFPEMLLQIVKMGGLIPCIKALYGN